METGKYPTSLMALAVGKNAAPTFKLQGLIVPYLHGMAERQQPRDATASECPAGPILFQRLDDP